MTSITLLLDNSSSTLKRLDHAIGCATAHNTSLTAVFLPAALRTCNDRDASKEWESRFILKAQAAGIQFDWINLSDAQNPWDQLLHLVHSTSMIVSGQTIGDCYDGELPEDLTERLVLGSGRPVVTVPCAGQFTNCARRVLVAWNDGRDSTRALHDSMPLLRKAQKVHLIKLITDEDAINGASDRLARIIRHLEDSGVRAKGDVVISLDFPPGDMLLNRACEESSDLLVMGAFRGDKPALGKIARHVLQHMTLPVLMSH